MECTIDMKMIICLRIKPGLSLISISELDVKRSFLLVMRAGPGKEFATRPFNTK